MSLQSQLKEIASKPNDAKYALYEALTTKTVASNNGNDILEIARHLVNVEGSEQFGRTYIVPDILNHIILLLQDPEQKNEDPMDVDDMLPLLKSLVDLIRPKAEDMPDALMNCLDLLAQCHQANKDFKSAAYTLSSFKFDDFKNKSSAGVDRRVSWFVQTAEFFLAIQESGLASQQIKRAHALISELSKLPGRNVAVLILRFKTCYARILDSERKFHEASLRYMELSQTTFDAIKDADRSQSLEYAISCAILAKAGAPRSRVLALLYSDERSKQLQNYGMLEKMFKDRIISNEEVVAFEKILQDHQKADTSNKRTVLQNSVIEHNMIAASKIYQNIRFDQLGTLLGIDSAEAEKLASNMIEQGRLTATIDQVESLLEFQSGGDELNVWDQQIGDVCMSVNRLLDDITRKYPAYDTV